MNWNVDDANNAGFQGFLQKSLHFTMKCRLDK